MLQKPNLKLETNSVVLAFVATMMLLHCVMLLIGSVLSMMGSGALLTAELAALAIIAPLLKVALRAYGHANRVESTRQM